MSGFKRGELILSSSPYAYVLSNTERGKRCDFCFLSNSELKRCSQCLFAYFCNKTCQRKAWDFHKNECKYIKQAIPLQPTPSLRLLSFLIFKVKKYGLNEPCEEVNKCKRVFADLESHANYIKRDKRTGQQMLAFIGTLGPYIGSENIPPQPQFAEIFGKMVINTFSIWDSEMHSIGSGLYLGPSIFDHSCEPNAEIVFEGTTLTVRAVCDIPSTDLRKVYVSYIDQMQLTKDRQEQLQAQYYFTCHCVRCTSTELDELMTKVHVKKEDAKDIEAHSLKEIAKLTEMKKNKEEQFLIQKVSMDELTSLDGVLSDTHLNKVKLVEFAFDACVRTESWTEGLTLGLELLKPYKLFYGDYHPNYCILLLKIAKIQIFLNQVKEGKEMLQKAEAALQISHGSSHPLFLELVNQKLSCARISNYEI